MRTVKNLGANKGFLSVEIIKVTSVPHLSILTGGDVSSEKSEQITLHDKLNMQGLLYELYQQYKQRLYDKAIPQNEAIELLWITRPVTNQPHEAAVDLYIIARSLQPTQQDASEVTSSMMAVCQERLTMGHFEFEDGNSHELSSTEAFMAMCQNVSYQSMKAIVKNERIDDLQNTMLQACYAYDTIPKTTADLSRLVTSIIKVPNCAVTFQLMPTFLQDSERQELTAKAQALNMIANGVEVQNVGCVKIESAGRAEASYRYYNDNGDQPLFLFNILAASGTKSNSQLTSSIMGQLNAEQNRMAGLNVVNLPQELQPNRAFLLSPWMVNEWLMNNARPKMIWTNTMVVPRTMWRMPFIITAEEASEFFRLPVGSDIIGAGLNVNETGRKSRSYAPYVLNQPEIPLGTLKSSPGKETIGLSCKDLAKHMFIAGVPGSGKTTFSVGLLDQLWRKHHIPFLVIEPAKNEYRALIKSIPELQVFTPGKNFISPFVFNPFMPPKNVRLETYKSSLKTAFAAGVSMTTPLDKIFEDSINNCYSDFNWLDTYTTDDKGKIFNITDFIKCFQQTFEEIGYTGDARNIGRAGIVRLKGLVNLFDNYFSIPIEDILSKPTIIELAAIENSDEKALIIALLLLSILAYVNANYVGEGGLRNFILLEEAHVLLDASSNGGEGAANPTAIAQGLLKRMLAEIRAYGVGLGIADQSPRKVGDDIVALTDIKVAFRLVESQDKEILANSTSMSDLQTARLAKLKPGEAFLFFNRLEEPEEIVTPDYRADHQISISLSDESIRQLSTYWNNRTEDLRPYPQCKLVQYCQHHCDYRRRLLAKEVARRLFRKHIGAGCNEENKLKSLLTSIYDLAIEEMNGEPYSDELLYCVKVYLWRHVLYETKLDIPNSKIIISLTN